MEDRPPTGFRCPRCADCCRVVRVPLTDADLLRLVRGTELSPASLVEWIEPKDIDMTGEPETFVCLREGRRLMVLAHGADGCRFLVDERCSVYPYRPATCAAYPFDLAPVADESRPGGARWLVVQLPGSICEPAELPAPDAVLRANSQVTQELRTYAERVTDWNRRQRLRVHVQRLPLFAVDFFRHLGITP